MSKSPLTAEELVSQLAAEIQILEGSAAALQSRYNVVKAAISEVTLAHATLEGLKKMKEGDNALIPIGANSYIRMTLADSQKLIMGIGAGAAIEKNVDGSLEELKTRLQELDKARSSLQEQLTQTLDRYERDREALSQLLRQRGATGRTGATPPST